ncbi:MAG: D-alanine--D-alanine ligase family protein [Acidimicrobiia bacterium]|nr:D-alanine--D-alanine ligase family protein [Acidimicrobiia bacterium]MDX2467206.1 D-alanine--D-alanine ligase family protein [Acidimicrobiia bacterium]
MARVVLLFGGRSAEHEVSCSSAVAVLQALRDAGHQVISVGIDRSGSWFLADDSRRPMVAAGRPVSFRVPEGRLIADRDEILFDVAFPVLHGPYGEDGTIQGAFEMANTPYVGCGVTASALAMEKDFAKQVFSQQRIPTARWVAVHTDDFGDPTSVVELIVRRLGLPVFVKPAELGSSVGVAKATTDAELKDAISDALRYGEKAIVEEFIDGREIEVAVLGGRASVPGEVVIKTDWYDYESKYNDESSEFVAPARLTPPQSTVVRDLAERAFHALGCKGLARVDFFFEEKGRGFVINEINTMPGFTSISGFPTMWQASGMTYGELCDELVQLALRVE